MAKYSISIAFDVTAKDYEDAHEKRDAIMYLVKSEKMCSDSQEIDVELTEDDEEEGEE